MLPVEVLREVVAQVHAAGGRVAVHSQQAEGGRVAVQAGVDTIDAGVSPQEALASASWKARAYFGFAGLEEGAAADAVVFETDPRSDLSVLDRPRAVIARGHLVISN